MMAGMMNTTFMNLRLWRLSNMRIGNGVRPEYIKTYQDFLKDEVLLEFDKYLIAYIRDKRYLCSFNSKGNVEYYELVSLK